MKIRVCASAALLLVVSVACGRDEEVTEPVLTGVDTLVVINGQVFLEDEFQAFLTFQEDGDLGVDPSLRKTRFIEFVTEKLILQEAFRDGIRIEDEEVEARLRRWLSQAREVPVGFEERVRNLLTVQKFVKEKIVFGVQVSNQEMYQYYASRSEEIMVNDQAHVLEILVSDKEAADKIYQQAQPGDVRTFKELARDYSSGLTADSGGDLGVFERGQLPQNFEQVIFRLAPGQISPVFQSQQGYHIFMMEEWVPRHAQKYYEVQDSIFEKLMAAKERQALDEYLDQLFAQASIEVHDPGLTLERSNGHANFQ